MKLQITDNRKHIVAGAKKIVNLSTKRKTKEQKVFDEGATMLQTHGITAENVKKIIDTYKTTVE